MSTQNETTLYKLDNRGQIRVWGIRIFGSKIIIRHGVHSGSMQTKTENITVGKAGRTVEEQISSRVRSRINEAYKKGYKDSIEEARDGLGKNQLGLYMPMLAQPFPNVRMDYNRPVYSQYKYDGHRCLITKDLAYSRKGQLINSIGHILEGIDLDPGETLDGELYCHGIPLQTISSWVRREQPSSANLRYHVYDIISNKPYEERLARLRSLRLGPFAEVVPTQPIGSPDDVPLRFRVARDSGYEGLILRQGDSGYEAGKRSPSLVKLKKTMDSYCPIVDVETSRDGWGILVCLTDKGKPFRVNPPGTMEDRYRVADYPTGVIGKTARIEYANLTKDGIPFHPIATLIE